MRMDLDFLGIRKREFNNAARRVSDAFDAKEITEKEFLLALPILIIDLFKFMHIENDAEAQQKFFKDIENSVSYTLRLAKDKGVL